jgi:SMODS-associating 2TM, beta-strand rich effector domain
MWVLLMVEYSLDTDVRVKVHFLLAAASIVLCYFAYSAMTPSASDVAKLGKISSAFVVFGLLLWSFDRFIWRWPVVRMLHGVPDLNGHWQGTIVRGDAPSDVRQIQAVITQNWHNIAVEVTAEHSRSSVKTAAILTKGATKQILYSYSKEPINAATGRFGEGFQQLKLVEKDKLSGAYFSTRLRGGETTLARQV